MREQDRTGIRILIIFAVLAAALALLLWWSGMGA